MFLMLISLTNIAIFSQKVDLTQKVDMQFKYERKPLVSEGVKTILVYTSSIVLSAVGDALYDEGIEKGGNLKGWGKVCKAGSLGILLTSPFYMEYDRHNWATYLASYTLIRFSVFDGVYNGVRGLPFSYIGTTSTVDKILAKGKVDPGFRTFVRGVSLVVGLSIPIENLNVHKLRYIRHNRSF